MSSARNYRDLDDPCVVHYVYGWNMIIDAAVLRCGRRTAEGHRVNAWTDDKATCLLCLAKVP